MLPSLAFANQHSMEHNDRSYCERFNIHRFEDAGDTPSTDKPSENQQSQKNIFQQITSSLPLPSILHVSSQESANKCTAIESELSAISSSYINNESYSEENTSEEAQSLTRRGKSMLRSAQYLEAIECFQHALHIQREIYGSRHGLVAATLNNIGVCYKHISRIKNSAREQNVYEEKAVSAFKEALSIFQEVKGPDHDVTQKNLHNLWQLMQEISERRAGEGQYISRDYRSFMAKTA